MNLRTTALAKNKQIWFLKNVFSQLALEWKHKHLFHSAPTSFKEMCKKLFIKVLECSLNFNKQLLFTYSAEMFCKQHKFITDFEN